MPFIRHFIVILCFNCFFMSSLFASEKMPYHHIGALGAEKSFAETYNGPLSPVFLYAHYLYDEQSGLFSKLYLTTVKALYKIGVEKDKVIFGLAPQLFHTIYGAYREYDQGIEHQDVTFNGNNSGVAFFFQYYWTTFFSTKVEYYPAYYFYNKKDETEIDLPENHWEHSPAMEFTLSTVTYNALGRIKEGVKCSLQYFYSHRVGYESFLDSNSGDVSDITNSHKLFATFGAYIVIHNFLNIQGDVLSAWHHNVDRNNAEKIGSYVADYAVMPGYYVEEFHHDRFIITKLQCGMPLGFWQSRIRPGFNLLYMPKNNKVVGAQDYPQKFYKSVSLSISMMLFNKVPFFVDYAYGLDADRRKSNSTEIQRGNHEFRAYVVTAFGKV